jgi:hypothetical protein
MIKLQNLAYYMRGKGARGGSNSQLHKHPFYSLPREGAYISSIRVGLLSLPFWAYTHVLGMLRERNRDVTGIGRGTLLLYPFSNRGFEPTVAKLKSWYHPGSGDLHLWEENPFMLDFATLFGRRFHWPTAQTTQPPKIAVFQKS